MRDGDAEFQGIDPVRARALADDWDLEGKTLTSIAAAIERIGREGLLDEAPSVAAHALRARDTIAKGSALLRRTSDAVEALDRSWSLRPRVRGTGGAGVNAGAVQRADGSLVRLAGGDTSAGDGSVAGLAAGAFSGSVADAALRAGWATTDQLATVPPLFAAEVALPPMFTSSLFSASGFATSTFAAGTHTKAGQSPTGVGPVGVTGPINWAGLSVDDVRRAELLVADLKKRPRPAADLSEEELLGVGVYLWDRQHTLDAKFVPELNDVDDVYYVLLTPRDQGRIRSVVMLLDAQAYERVDALKSPHANELMQYLLSRERFGDDLGEVVAYAKEKFGITDPVVLDATTTWITYQLRGAYFMSHELRPAHTRLRPDAYAVHGWLAPNVQVEEWALQTIWSSSLSIGPPQQVMRAARTFTGLMQGRVPSEFDQAFVPKGAAPPLSTAEKALLAGTLVTLLIVAGFAVVEAVAVDAIASGLATVGLTAAAASAIAPVIYSMLIGVVSAIGGGLAERATRAAGGELDWDKVFTKNTIGRDAFVGGATALVTAGFGRGLSKLATKYAATEGRLGIVLKRIAAARVARLDAQQIRTLELEAQQLRQQAARESGELTALRKLSKVFEDRRARLATVDERGESINPFAVFKNKWEAKAVDNEAYEILEETAAKTYRNIVDHWAGHTEDQIFTLRAYMKLAIKRNAHPAEIKRVLTIIEQAGTSEVEFNAALQNFHPGAYKANLAHVPHSPEYNPKKTPEPKDVMELFNRSILADDGMSRWTIVDRKNGQKGFVRFWGRSPGQRLEDVVYHFSGNSFDVPPGGKPIPLTDVPTEIQRIAK